MSKSSYSKFQLDKQWNINIPIPSEYISLSLLVLDSQPSSSWGAHADRILQLQCTCTVGTWWWCQDRAASFTTPSHASSHCLGIIPVQRWRDAAWPPPCRTILWWSRYQNRTGRCAPSTYRAAEWTWPSDRCWGQDRASQIRLLITKGLMSARQMDTMTTQQKEKAGRGRGVVTVILML